MRTILATIAAVALLVAPAAAQQLTVGPGGVTTWLEMDGKSMDVGDLFAELEYQVPMNTATTHWLGVAPSIAGDTKTKGMALRYYFETAGGAAYPGFGIAAYRIGGDDLTALGADTWFVGGEVLLEFSVPMGDTGDIPATAVVGIYPSISGAKDATMIRLGVKVAPDLLQ